MPDTYIPAKPTIYRGVKYRSRLEATWAVFLHNYCEYRNTLEPERHWYLGYEPMSEPDTQRIYQKAASAAIPGYTQSEMYAVRQYNPDFLLGVEIQGWGHRLWLIEMKPVPPNEEYVKTLRGVAQLYASLDLQLIMVVGGLRDKQPARVSEYPYRYNNWYAFQWFTYMYTSGLAGYAESVERLYDQAGEFRWDLYQGG